MRRLVTAPTIEPVNLDEAKDHLNVMHYEDDALISRAISSAREQAEVFTRRVFISQTWDISLKNLPQQGIRLFPSPVIAIESITYVDTSGQTQTLAADQYQVVRDPHDPRIIPAYGVRWPAVLDHENSVTVRAAFGYGQAGDVPASIKAAIFLLVGEMYQHREETGPSNLGTLPLTSERLLWPFRDMRAQ